MGEMIKTSYKICYSCKYGKIFTTKNEPPMCDYLCMTYKSRGCKRGKCDKYEPKVKES